VVFGENDARETPEDALAVPTGLEPVTFGLGNRCLHAKGCPSVLPRFDLIGLFRSVVPTDPSHCHPVSDHWVAILGLLTGEPHDIYILLKRNLIKKLIFDVRPPRVGR